MFYYCSVFTVLGGSVLLRWLSVNQNSDKSFFNDPFMGLLSVWEVVLTTCLFSSWSHDSVWACESLVDRQTEAKLCKMPIGVRINSLTVLVAFISDASSYR